MSFVGEGSQANSLPLAEMGIEIVWERARGHLPKVILAIAVLASRLVGIAWLRPYEGIYSNGLIGGERDPSGNSPTTTGAPPTGRGWLSSIYAEMDTVHEGRVDGVLLAVVKQGRHVPQADPAI
jgi:hypothetical protein